MNRVASQLIMTAPNRILRNTVLEITSDNRVSKLWSLSELQTETAGTLFFDGIISAGIVSLNKRAYNIQQIPENYLYLNIKNSELVNLELNDRILILDADTEDPLEFSIYLKKTYSMLSHLNIADIIAASSYYPAYLCKPNHEIEPDNKIQALLWTNCNLPERKLKPETVVTQLFKLSQSLQNNHYHNQQRTMKYIIKIFILSAIAMLMAACSLLIPVSTQYDDVLNVERHRFDAEFSKDQPYEQEYWQNISIVKERSPNGEYIYTMYDVITLPYGSFNLSDKMYIIIDKKVIELTNTVSESSSHSKINKKTESILKADSTKIDVVTGYNEQYLKTYKMTHPLNNEIIERIADANSIYLRYYSGPNLITSEINYYRLTALKKLIQK